MENTESNHILIVDDSLDQQFLLKMLLESKGYTTESSLSGEEALILLHSRKKMPQTILLDLNMTGMNGFEFRQLQRNDPLLKNIPVIVVSGDDDVQSIQLKTNTDVLTKPLKINSLLTALKNNTRLH
jgi:CheY-like chemotaxis protein